MRNKKFLLFFSLLCFNSAMYAQTRVSIETTKGTMVIELYDKTPKHKANFVKLAKSGFYDSTLFHRVIGDFMIQAGDPESKGAPKGQPLGMGGPGYRVDAEINNDFIHKKGALAAARQGDNVNPKRASSGSQFYIVEGKPTSAELLSRFEESRGEPYTANQKKIYETLGGTPHLDGQYTVFGEIVKGLEVVDAISMVKTARGDRPVEDIMIVSMKLLD